MKRVDLSDSEKQRFLIAKGDLLFARRSLVAEGAGKCCVVLDVDEPTTFESSVIRARPDGLESDSLFLYYFFTSPSGLHSLDTIRRQVAVSGVTGRDLSNLDVPVPSPVEQRAVAHILGTLDDKIELNRRMNATLETMARALFRSWFVDFDPVRAKMEGRDTGLPKAIADLFPDRLVDSELGEIPDGWQLKPLDSVASFQNGLALQKFPPSQNEARLPVVKITQTCVSTFDGFGRELCRVHINKARAPLRVAKMSFQNLHGAAKGFLDLFGIDLSKMVELEEWRVAVKVFQKRHLIAHKLGVVDRTTLRRRATRMPSWGGRLSSTLTK